MNAICTLHRSQRNVRKNNAANVLVVVAVVSRKSIDNMQCVITPHIVGWCSLDVGPEQNVLNRVRYALASEDVLTRVSKFLKISAVSKTVNRDRLDSSVGYAEVKT